MFGHTSSGAGLVRHWRSEAWKALLAKESRSAFTFSGYISWLPCCHPERIDMPWWLLIWIGLCSSPMKSDDVSPACLQLKSSQSSAVSAVNIYNISFESLQILPPDLLWKLSSPHQSEQNLPCQMLIGGYNIVYKRQQVLVSDADVRTQQAARDLHLTTCKSSAHDRSEHGHSAVNYNANILVLLFCPPNLRLQSAFFTSIA